LWAKGNPAWSPPSGVALRRPEDANSVVVSLPPNCSKNKGQVGWASTCVKGEEGDAVGTNLRLEGAAKSIRRQISHLRLQVLDLEVGVALGGGHPGVAQ